MESQREIVSAGSTSGSSAEKSNSRLFVLPVLIVFCALFYYFGELVDWAGWNSLRASFLYSIHDVHRLLFLAPIVYAAYTARVRGALIVTLVAFVIFLPRAFFISPYPDPFLRMVIFTVFAGAIGCLVGVVRNQSVRSRQMEGIIAAERDKLLKIVDRMAYGLMITGPDYGIRFLNAKMTDTCGAGAGRACYRHLSGRDVPCPECRLRDVIREQEVTRWECRLADGRMFEVVAAPYVDVDGAACQISIFSEVSGTIPGPKPEAAGRHSPGPPA